MVARYSAPSRRTPSGPSDSARRPARVTSAVELAPPVPACVHEDLEVQTGTPYPSLLPSPGGHSRRPGHHRDPGGRRARARARRGRVTIRGVAPRRRRPARRDLRARGRARPAREQRLRARGVLRRHLPRPLRATTSCSRRGTGAGASGSSPPACASFAPAASRRDFLTAAVRNFLRIVDFLPALLRRRRDLDPGHEPEPAPRRPRRGHARRA